MAECTKCGRSYEPDPAAPGRGCPRCAESADPSAGPAAETMNIPAFVRSKTSPGGAAVRLPPARTFAQYEILDEIGRGAYGVVYKAVDPELRRAVALKVLLAAEHASPEEVERFFREASSAAKLQHPNIVPIHEFKSFEGKPYYTMDLVEGHALDELIAGKALNVRQSLELVEKVARALNHAHSRGIVHRDLKPGNIMVTREGEPMIADFGLAKVLDGPEDADGRGGSGQLTRSGVAMGTPQYMAPEQATGRNREIDARADIYALGCILYELITGAPPFNDANAMELLRAHVERDPAPPSSRGARVAADVETICLKCLEKVPDRRYRTAAALADDVRRFLDGEPIAARRASVAYVVGRKLLRHKALAAVSAVAAALLVALTAWYILKLRQERDLMERALYRANLGLAHEQAMRGYAARADNLLADCPEPLRHWEWGLVKREAHQELATLAGHGDDINALAASADGRWLASAGEDRTVRLWDAASGREELSIGGPTAFKTATFDRESRRLAAGGADGALTVWEVPGGRQLLRIQAHAEPVRATAFSPDGRRLVSAGDDRAAVIWDAATGESLRALKGHSAPVYAAAFSPDGARLATGGHDSKVRVWDAGSGAELKVLDASGRVAAAAWSPDGARLAAGTMEDVTRLWDAGSWEPCGVLRGHIAAISCVAFSPDGSRLASGCVDGTVKLWDPAGCRELCMLRGHGDAVWGLAFGPDGSRLVTGGSDRAIKVWDLARDRSCQVLGETPGYIRSLAYSPDGRSLVSGHSDAAVHIWDLEAGRERALPAGHTLSVRTTLFSADGRQVITCGSDGTIRFWDAATGEQLRSQPGPDGSEPLLAISRDGGRLAAGGATGPIRLLDAASGRELLTVDGHQGGVYALAFSPDGRWLASGGAKDGRIVIRDAADGRERRVISGLVHSVHALAFSPDGRRLASAIGEGGLKAWEVPAGRQVFDMTGHQGQIRALAYSADGERLVTGGSDQALRIWDARAGRVLLTVGGHRGKIYALAFSPDGRSLASGGRDKTIRVWMTDDWHLAAGR